MEISHNVPSQWYEWGYNLLSYTFGDIWWSSCIVTQLLLSLQWVLKILDIDIDWYFLNSVADKFIALIPSLFTIMITTWYAILNLVLSVLSWFAFCFHTIWFAYIPFLAALSTFDSFHYGILSKLYLLPWYSVLTSNIVECSIFHELFMQLLHPGGNATLSTHLPFRVRL